MRSLTMNYNYDLVVDGVGIKDRYHRWLEGICA
jgi:hypothetical protein